MCTCPICSHPLLLPTQKATRLLCDFMKTSHENSGIRTHSYSRK
nr:MAG TPA: RimK-related lysine biosynthesis protein, Probable-dependent amine/thiol ligase family Amino-group [Caudoviricetes sp.]